MATKFLQLSILASTISEINMPPTTRIISFSTDSTSTDCWFELDFKFHLASLACSLEAVLAELEAILVRRDRREWASGCFALCLIFFAAESMQVDILLKYTTSEGRSKCEAMMKTSILPLAELFSASTAGFRPLDLDWKLEENAALVDNNHQIIESLQSLQTLSQEYSKFCENLINFMEGLLTELGTFLEQRRLTKDLTPGMDSTVRQCLTGKLVAEILR
ncbi:MAG: hypothetical protein LQ347_001935 [Umbilicaria vellea]|nr:MAG: hypothetical protein LQ347_001935 [Umbilicaria vellea]